MPLQCEKVALNGVTVIYCRGGIVLGDEVDQLHTTVLSAIKETARVVLHLAAVTTIDSAGLGALAGLCISARNHDGDMKLADLSPKIRQVLETTRLSALFEVYPTAQQAAAAFSATPRDRA